MKRFSFCAILLLTACSLFAQVGKKNKIYVVAAPAASIYGYDSSMDGGGSYEDKMGYTAGLEYSREIFKNFELLTGVNYASNTIDWEGDYIGPEVERGKGSFDINYISVPLQARMHFSNFFFVNGGAILNFRTSSGDEGENDKLGLLFGIGGKIDIDDRYFLIVNPYFQVNYLSSTHSMRFFNLGAKVGVGCKF